MWLELPNPVGGNNEYLIGLQKWLLASISAGNIILTFISSSMASMFRPSLGEKIFRGLQMVSENLKIINRLVADCRRLHLSDTA